MALQNDTSRIQYNGNNSTTSSYAIPFVFFENAHIKCVVTSSTNVDTTLTLGSTFNVTGAGNPNGGSLTTTTAVPTSSKVTIFREVPATQTTSYQEGGDFPAASHERALDKLTMIAQQTKRLADRAIKVPETQNNPNDLPNASTGSKLLTSTNGTIGWDENRNPPPYPATAGTQALVTAGSGAAPNWQTIPAIAAGPITATGSTTPRLLSDRSADWLNVKDFGAVGDGVNDDAPAFRAAAQIAYNTGKTVYFPSGTYRMASLTTGATSLPSGSGRIISFINNTSTPKQFSVIGDNAVLTTPLYPQRYTNYGDEFTMIYLLGNFSKVHFEGLRFVCTQPLHTANFTWNVVVPGAYGRTFGVFMSGGEGNLYWSKTIRPRNVTFSNCSFTDFLIGCRVDNAENMLFDQCGFYYTKGKASVGDPDWSVGVASRQVQGLTLTNSVFDGCTSNSLTDVSPYPQVTCTDGLILASRGTEHATEGLVITNNHIRNFAYEGIYVLGFPESTTTPADPAQSRVDRGPVITGNSLDGRLPAGTQSSTSNYGIRIDYPNSIVSNNCIYEVNAPIMVSSNVLASDNNYGLAGHFTRITNNFIVMVSGSRLGSKSCIAISVGYAEGVVIAENTILGRDVVAVEQRGWTGALPRSAGNSDNTVAPLNIPTGISIGNGVLVPRGKTFVRNNVFRILSRNASNVLTTFMQIDGQGVCYIDSNYVENSSFFAYRQGGAFVFSLARNNKFINGLRLLSGYVFDGFESVVFSKHTFTFVPSQSGWHQLHFIGRRNFGGKITFSTSSETALGDPVFGGTAGNQNTEVLFSCFANSGGGDVRLALNQLYHAGGTNPMVDKIYLAPSNDRGLLYFHVPRTTTKVRLLISGGGGSGASANATIANGIITGITDLVGGTGYTSAPSVTVEQEMYINTGTPATFTATISGGSVSAVTLASSLGSNYQVPVSITVESDEQNELPMFGVHDIRPSNAPSNGIELIFRSGSQSIAQDGFGLFVRGAGIPNTGTAAPTSTPLYVGQTFIDTSNDKAYIATGTTNSSDWKNIVPDAPPEQKVMTAFAAEYNTSNSTTLADTGLSLNLPVGVYSVVVDFSNGNAGHAMGFKSKLTFTGSASELGLSSITVTKSNAVVQPPVTWGFVGGYNTLVEVRNNGSVYVDSVEATNVDTFFNGTSGAFVTIRCMLNVTTSGNLKLQAAQAVSDALNFKIFSGQRIVAIKM